MVVVAVIVGDTQRGDPWDFNETRITQGTDPYLSLFLSHPSTLSSLSLSPSLPFSLCLFVYQPPTPSFVDVTSCKVTGDGGLFSNGFGGYKQGLPFFSPVSDREGQVLGEGWESVGDK